MPLFILSIFFLFFSLPSSVVSLTADDLHHTTILLHFSSALSILNYYIYRSKTNIEYANKQKNGDPISVVHSRKFFFSLSRSPSLSIIFLSDEETWDISMCCGYDAVDSYIGSIEIDEKMRNLVLSEFNSIGEIEWVSE
jgi:hypothetical protein